MPHRPPKPPAPPRPEPVPEVKTRHRIYTVSPDGLLKTPKRDGYGAPYDIFDDYETPEAAQEALLKSEDALCGDYLVLPVLIKTFSYPE